MAVEASESFECNSPILTAPFVYSVDGNGLTDHLTLNTGQYMDSTTRHWPGRNAETLQSLQNQAEKKPSNEGKM